MPLKGISYLELWQSFCSAEHYHLSNFGRPRGTMLCNYFEFGSVVKEMSLKRFIWSSGDPLLLSGAEPFMQFWKEGIMGNNHVKLNEIRTSGSGGDFV